MKSFLKDQVIFLNDHAHQVISYSENATALVERSDTGERFHIGSEELLHAWVAGTLLVRRLKLSNKPEKPKATASAYSMEGTEAARTATALRIEYIRRLEDRGAFDLCQAKLKQMVTEVAKELQDRRTPHFTSIYRWRRHYIAAMRDVRALVVKFSLRGASGKSRLHPEIEEIIDEKVLSILDQQKRWSSEDVWEGVHAEISQRNALKPSIERLDAPSLRTVQRRLSQQFSFDVAVARYGLKEAERRFAYRGPSRAVKRILEVVEIDITPVDIILVDEKGVAIGRPDAVFLLDRKSRCVLGFVLSLGGHGVPVIFDAIRHALLPKTYLKDKYPDLDLEWPCFGWFELLLMDNGSELVSISMFDALIALGIAIEMARSRTPNDKAHIERFNRTFNYSFIHKLPGTTLAKYDQRIGFKAEDEAVLTLDDLNRLVHIWICTKYHNRPHAGLNGKAPITVWKEGAADFPPQLKANREEIDIEFSQYAESSLQPYGIDLNTFRYSSPELALLRAKLPPKTKVCVKWPRYDAGFIWVWNPHDDEFMKVPNTQPQFSGLTVDQARLANQKLEDDPALRQARVEAGEIIRQEAAALAERKGLKTKRKSNKLLATTTGPDNRNLGDSIVERAGLADDLGKTVVAGADLLHALKVHLPDLKDAYEIV